METSACSGGRTAMLFEEPLNELTIAREPDPRLDDRGGLVYDPNGMTRLSNVEVGNADQVAFAQCDVRCTREQQRVFGKLKLNQRD